MGIAYNFEVYVDKNDNNGQFGLVYRLVMHLIKSLVRQR